MGSSKLKRAIGAVKDQTSVGLAKVGGRSASLSELDVAIVKATRHEEYPAEEKYIREILSLTSYSRNYISACVNTLSRRLNKTKNWTVALKTLILIQRLLGEGDQAYEQEIFFATRRGTRLLNMSDFRDASRSNSWDYSAFVRTYALYLDERLDFRMQGRHGKRGIYSVSEEEEDRDHDRDRDREESDLSSAIVVRSMPISEMKTEQIFTRVHHLQQLLDRFLACRPTGSARNNRVVVVALYPIVKESFQIYYDITEILGILIDRFMELDIPNSIKVYDIFCRVSKQFDELDSCFTWYKNMGIARSSEYPEVEKITQKKLDLMDEFIRDKSALVQTQKTKSLKSEADEGSEKADNESEAQEDMNSIKALPEPPPKVQEPENEQETEEGLEIEKQNQQQQQQQEGDLLNLADTAGETSGGDSLALALFDGAVSETATAPPWEAFKDDAADWETALVQSETNLSGQKTQLGGGFDMLLLDGMYQHGATTAAVNASTAYGASGSASSVAFGSAGRPAPTMLALPAPPPTGNSNGNGSGPVNLDPFAASLAVAPPPYVQMQDMEKKQRLLKEEQIMWEQYSKDGKQGHLGFRQNLNPNFPYSPSPFSYSPRY
ncbi:PREDICTED: putative clathrin assembly protein At1g03050 [Tarenaya hassleriana]|uniref:putative clathrin assembly protein At1g03050 n=1 Tax=Tarenaya hassleriana TaxID=28532 RepID=UPI00053C6017|nr:PREDICTED: putative clathrin assembly protein At1g03050 [Tarenaya hassleriana]XP_010522756.1 PREDICTED: putative clathrin assembly protein At1g03050 [Tarenaya hassleriana]XP_019056570.1 PREDICTED: putative clathrin assembly protein At1g03050 [Tarenaya hassleriana]